MGTKLEHNGYATCHPPQGNLLYQLDDLVRLQTFLSNSWVCYNKIHRHAKFNLWSWLLALSRLHPMRLMVMVN